MDGVLANNKLHYIHYYWQETGTQIDEQELTGRSELASLPDETAVGRYLRTPGFFRTLPVAANAKEVVKELSEHYDIFVVSAAMQFPLSLAEKKEWLDEHFPFISWTNIVFCGDKHIIHTDYLLDDHVKNLRTFSGTGLLFDAFHNVHETEFERMADWLDVHRFFLSENRP